MGIMMVNAPYSTRSVRADPIGEIIDLSRRVTVRTRACTAACGTGADGA